VVRGQEQIVVRGADRQDRPVVEVMAYDAARDLAIVRVEAPYAGLPLADDRPLVGETVLAIGNPLGFEATVSAGIVSGLRLLEGNEMLQITAPISPGSSGGPVIDPFGAVLGVSTLTFTKGQNLNFAVPARYLRELLHAPRPMSLAAFAAASRPEPAPAEAAAPPSHLRLVRVTKGVDVKLVRLDDAGRGLERPLREADWAKASFDFEVRPGERWQLVAHGEGFDDLVQEIVFPRGVSEMTLRVELTKKSPARP
jgi:S1-C subfamily serine protease